MGNVRASTSGVAWRRLPLLLPGLLALVAGLAAGLWRLGAWVPADTPPLLARAVVNHGALMVCGFFGVVISLERAVALAARGAPGLRGAWPWAAPLLAALGSALALAGAPWSAGAPVAWVGAALVLLGATLRIWRLQPEPFVGVLALGAAAWVIGNALWLAGAGAAQAVLWWIAFLVFTIAGERLELSRLAPRPPRAQVGFALVVALMLAALFGQTAQPQLAQAAFGACLLALAAWLARYDLARRTVRQRGLTRFIALSLLAGYGWLAVGGALLVGALPGSPRWDAALHALLIGFVFSMVFGHAPIVLPAVLRVVLPYRRRFYVPLLLLHAAVALRVTGGLADLTDVRRASAWLSVLAIAVFIVTMLTAARGARPPGRGGGAAGTAPAAKTGAPGVGAA